LEQGARADAGQGGETPFEIEHVGDAHPVERPLHDGTRHVEIAVKVEVHQVEVSSLERMGEHGSDPHRAVSSEDERDLAIRDRSSNILGVRPYARHHGVRVLRPGVIGVGHPAEERDVAVVDHLEVRIAQTLHQAGASQGCGRPLLTRGERSRAGWSADDPDLAIHRPELSAGSDRREDPEDGALWVSQNGCAADARYVRG